MSLSVVHIFLVRRDKKIKDARRGASRRNESTDQNVLYNDQYAVYNVYMINKTLIIFWKTTNTQEEIAVGGVDFDPSGTFWYYMEDPNVRVEVRPNEYCWMRVV